MRALASFIISGIVTTLIIVILFIIYPTKNIPFLCGMYWIVGIIVWILSLRIINSRDNE